MRADAESLKATYLKHTAYHHFAGGLKKLEFIVEILCSLRREPARVCVLDVGCGNGGDVWTAVDRLDSRLADVLPASMASGWYLLCRKTTR